MAKTITEALQELRSQASTAKGPIKAEPVGNPELQAYRIYVDESIETDHSWGSLLFKALRHGKERGIKIPVRMPDVERKKFKWLVRQAQEQGKPIVEISHKWFYCKKQERSLFESYIAAERKRAQEILDRCDIMVNAFYSAGRDKYVEGAVIEYSDYEDNGDDA